MLNNLEDNSMKESEYIEDTSNQDDICGEILLLYQEIITEDSITPKSSSINIHHEETERREKELANTPLETCERV